MNPDAESAGKRIKKFSFCIMLAFIVGMLFFATTITHILICSSSFVTKFFEKIDNLCYEQIDKLDLLIRKFFPY